MCRNERIRAVQITSRLRFVLHCIAGGIIRWSFIAALAIALAFGASLAYQNSANQSHKAKAAGGVTFSEFSIHPYASQSGYNTGVNNCSQAFCPAGQTLFDLGFTADGHLIAGYGDWLGNSDTYGVAAGRVGVVPLNVQTNTWGDMYYLGSESSHLIRELNGHVYVPTTDPSNRRAHEQDGSNRSGYLTNDSGSWRFVRTPNETHTMDVTTLDGTDLYTIGSSGLSSIPVRQSVDSGTSWTTPILLPYTSIHNWIVELSGNLYTKSSNSNTLHQYDGTSWTSTESPDFCSLGYTQGNKLASFDDKIICGTTASNLKTFDGTSVTPLSIPGLFGDIHDFYQTENHLYLLSASGLFRTTSLLGTWEHISNNTQSAKSVAVYQNYVYLGGDQGRIYKSDIDLTTIPPVTFTDEDCFVFNSSTGTITDYLIDAEQCTAEVEIPSTIGGIAVTAIGSNTFRDNQLTSATIPSSVTSIGLAAFWGNMLTSIHIPDSVTTLGNQVFYNNQLTTLSIPSGISTIGSYTFAGNQLTTLTIPDNITSLGYSAFSSNQLTSVTLTSGLTTIGDSAFSGNKLASISIPGSVTTIGNYAFSINQLTSVTIPNSVTSIGSYAFSSNKLTTVTLPENLTTINNAAFQNNQLTSVIIPDSVTTIHDFAFYSNKLTSLTIPNNVTSISNLAFGSNLLAEVTIPDSALTIGNMAFIDNQITSLTIPANVLSIGSFAFSDNQLNSVSVLGSNTNTSDSAFAYRQTEFSNSEFNNRMWNSTLESFLQTLQVIDMVPMFASAVPHNQTDSLSIQDWIEVDGDDDWNDFAPAGGHLVNPSNLTINYRDQHGNQIAPSTTKFGTDDTVTSYKMMQFVDWSNQDNPVLIQEKLGSLYRIGDSVSVDPPVISGYFAPQAQTVGLSEINQSVTLTYIQPVIDLSFIDNILANNILGPAQIPEAIKHRLLANSSLALADTNTCQSIRDASLLSPANLNLNVETPAGAVNSQRVGSSTTILGGLQFILDRCPDGTSTHVNFTLGEMIDDPEQDVKVFKHHPDAVTVDDQLEDITDLVAFSTVNGKTVLSYSLADGGELDEDGVVNGEISDPIYVGITTSLLDGLEPVGDDAEPAQLAHGVDLADTGSNMVLIGTVAALTLVFSALIMAKYTKLPYNS